MNDCRNGFKACLRGTWVSACGRRSVIGLEIWQGNKACSNQVLADWHQALFRAWASHSNAGTAPRFHCQCKMSDLWFENLRTASKLVTRCSQIFSNIHNTVHFASVNFTQKPTSLNAVVVISPRILWHFSELSGFWICTCAHNYLGLLRLWICQTYTILSILDINHTSIILS